MEKILIIDGHSLLYRAFYALPPLSTRDGKPTGAVYGFLNMLARLLKEQSPQYLAVAFDMREKTFRHEQYKEYKAGRKETPPELLEQFTIIQEILRAMGIAILQQPRYEADDILGYFAALAKDDPALTAVLVTGDNDACQLAGDGVQVLLTKRGITETQLLDAEGVREKLGVLPHRVPDLKGLMGDSSDNIPGVPGIGPKTAAALLAQYDSLEEVLAHREEVPQKRAREALITYEEQARMSKQLATIDPAVPEMPALSLLSYQPPAGEAMKQTLLSYELGGLYQRFAAETTPAAASGVEPQKTAPDMPQKTVAAHPEKTTLLLENQTLTLYKDQQAQTISLQQEEVQESFLAPEQGMQERQGIQLPRIDIASDCKAIAHALADTGGDASVLSAAHDLSLAAYVCDPAQGRRDFTGLCQRYGVDDARDDAAILLFEALEQQLERDGCRAVYEEIERPLWQILFSMEQHGFVVSRTVLEQMQTVFESRIAALEEQIYEAAGCTFNINSPKQLGEVLFEKLQLPVIKTTKTKGYSTDAEVLDQLSDKHPVVAMVLEYRSDAKLKSTYLDGLLAVMGEDGRVHTRFTQNVTATGRLSSIEPNLQNIPIRTEKGREIRRAFVAGGENRRLVAADYSQIELRLLAHFSEDPAMIETFLQNGDIHQETAARVFGVAPSQVTDQQRSAAKAVNFGIVYGISDFGLAKNIGVSREKAAEYINTYFERFLGIKAYLDHSVARAQETGFAETYFGRRRYIPELSSKNYNMRSFGKRVAMNAPLQGTAADIIKLAMIRVQEALAPYGEDAVLILQVHDELIVDCKEALAQQVADIMKTAMEQVVALRVPLTVSIGIGKDWLSAK